MKPTQLSPENADRWVRKPTSRHLIRLGATSVRFASGVVLEGDYYVFVKDEGTCYVTREEVEQNFRPVDGRPGWYHDLQGSRVEYLVASIDTFPEVTIRLPRYVSFERDDGGIDSYNLARFGNGFTLSFLDRPRLHAPQHIDAVDVSPSGCLLLTIAGAVYSQVSDGCCIKAAMLEGDDLLVTFTLEKTYRRSLIQDPAGNIAIVFPCILEQKYLKLQG